MQWGSDKDGQVASLRKTFKKLFAGQDLDAISHLKPSDFAALSQPQMFRVIASVEENAWGGEPYARHVVSRNAHSGLLFNPDVRDWYGREQRKVLEYTQSALAGIWEQPRDMLEEWLEEGHALARQKFPDFFRIRRAVDFGLAARFEQHDLFSSNTLRKKRQSLALAPKAPLGFDIVLYGDSNNALEQFGNGVANACRHLPPFLKYFAMEFGYQFRVARRLGIIDPQYTEQASWDERHTYEEVSLGIHQGGPRIIDLPMGAPRKGKLKKNRLVGAFERVNQTRRDKIETIGHEIVHGINRMMGAFSDYSNAMAQAYNEDITNLMNSHSEDERKMVGYFLPKSANGRHDHLPTAREEAFCEIMIELAQGPDGNIEIAPYFPQTAAMVKQVIDFLHCEYAVFSRALDFPDMNRFNEFVARRAANNTLLTRYR